jgi:hypothetical protein
MMGTIVEWLNRPAIDIEFHIRFFVNARHLHGGRNRTWHKRLSRVLAAMRAKSYLLAA